MFLGGTPNTLVKDWLEKVASGEEKMSLEELVESLVGGGWTWR